MARAGEEDLELHYTATVRTQPPPQAAGTVYFAMDVDDVPAALGSRPDRLSEVRPQERAQRRTVQQIVDPVLLPTLDDPAPQMVEQLRTSRISLTRLHLVPSRSSKCPRSCLTMFPCEPRFARRSWRNCLWKCRRSYLGPLRQLITKQNVDVPVPCRGGRLAGLQGFLPRQSSTALPSLERISERIVEQNVDFPVGGGLQDFLPGQSSSASSSSPAGVHGSADVPGEGFFSHFSPKEKKCEGRSALESESAPRVEPIHPGSSRGRVVGSGASGQVPAAL